MHAGTVQTDVVSVSEYATRMGRALRSVGPAVIEGEIQKPKRSDSGAFWFALTDGDSVLTCKVFRRQAEALEHVPREGDLVRIEVERPDLWTQAGKLDLIVGQIRLAGEGELLRRRQELIDRFNAEGLCDPARRRPLPEFPRAVGVIAGKESDAMSDVVRALVDRWPCVHIVKCSSLVQGKHAPRDLIDALAHMTEHPPIDVVILARGGGSVQDLACFDDEGLCRAIFACELPVVCAIGHTDNNPVCNHIAWAAYTPSRSVELVVPHAAGLRQDIAVARAGLEQVPRRIGLMVERLQRADERVHCTAKLDTRSSQTRELANRIQTALGDFFADRKQSLQYMQSALAATPHRAARELGSEKERLLAATSSLALTGMRVDRLIANVAGLGDTVRVGTRRARDDHRRDYGRALERLLREARAGVNRRFDRVDELVGHQQVRLGEHSRQRLSDARREAEHAGAVIAARDFRRRGWLLATADDGTPVRSTTDLRSGQQIDLHLHGGRASAVINTVNSDNGSKTT